MTRKDYVIIAEVFAHFGQMVELEETIGADIARNLLAQANLMEEDAQGLMREAEAKKAEAYRLDPSLRGPGRPRKVK
jgi:hypothetical protein